MSCLVADPHRGIFAGSVTGVGLPKCAINSEVSAV